MLPRLSAGTLQLVALSDEHATFEHELDSDPTVMKFLTGRGATAAESIETHGRRLELMKKVESNGLGYWVGYLEGQPVGIWMLKPPKSSCQDKRAEIGYRVLSRFWRQGLASMGSMAVLRYAFEVLEMDCVYGETMFVNDGSRAVMAKIGMQYTRTFFEDFDDPLPGSEHGEVEYIITREVWKQMQST